MASETIGAELPKLDWHDVTECGFCGSRKRSVYMKTRKAPWYERRALRLVKCEVCGLVFASPRPDERQIYVEYLTGAAAAREAYARKLNRPNVAAVHRKHVETALKALGRPAERVFDVGCGAGTVMVAAREAGLEAHGNEINKVAADTLTEMGFTIHNCFTQDLKVEPGSFDIVFNFDYLEHSYTPFADLKVCCDMLRPDGVLFLKTLYLGSRDHRRDGESWRLFGPYHFHFFFPDVLLRMIREAGFTVEHVETPNLIFVLARRS